MDLSTIGYQMSQAGWTMLPLLACSVAALALVLHKIVEFWRDGVNDVDVLEAAAPYLRTDRLDELRGHCLAAGSPTGRVMAATAAAMSENPRRAESVGMRACDREIGRYQRWIPTLGWIAQVAPLFGLLGTVIGMVELFSALEAAGATADTAMITGGIWKALLTTAAGLIIAIPALGAHLWLVRRLEDLDRALEEAVGLVVDLGQTP